MYVWRNENRRDRRHHTTSNPWTPPTAIDVEGYKKWFQERQERDERSRLKQEEVYVEGYAARRLKAYRAYLETGWGKTEVRLMAVSLAQIRAAETRKEMRRNRRQAFNGGVGQTTTGGAKPSSVMQRILSFLPSRGAGEDDSLFESQEDQASEQPAKGCFNKKRSAKPNVGADGKAVLVQTSFQRTEYAADMDRAEAEMVFRLFDGDSTGSIDKDELSSLMQQLCIPLSEKELKDLMKELDKDESGTIDFDEFYSWYQDMAKKQKGKRRLKSAGLQVNKFLRAIRGLTLETETRNIMLAHEEHEARGYAMRDFRASRPPTHMCSECGKAYLTGRELDLHATDESVHEDWRAQKAVTAERFLCVTNVLEGPMGRSLKCLRAQFDPILHTTPVRTDMPALVARPMLADPGGKRLKQLVNGMAVETLMVYFSKRAPPANAWPLHSRQPFKPADLPQSLTNLALRLLHEDRSIFTAHMRDAKHAPAPKSLRPWNEPSAADMFAATAVKTRARIDAALEKLRQLKPNDPAFNVKVQSHGSAGVDLEFRWKTGTHATLLGSFTGWEEEIMHFEFDTQEHSLKKTLSVGVHLYCFRVNGHLRIDATKPVVGSGTHRRNILTVWDGLEYEGPLAKDALTSVELPHQNIGDQGLWFLFSLLELTRPLLLSMDLSFNCISSQGMSGVAPLLIHLPHLRCLKLNANGIGFDGARALGRALEQNVAIATLELANNPIGDDGVEALSKGLQGNGNLTQLNLDNAMVGDDGLSALADMLIKNAALRSLTMRYNCFTHRAVMSSLHPSLLRNASLTSLQLSHNYLGPDALQSFGHILCANNALRSLQLDNCYVCGKDGRARHGMHHLADSLTENKGLTQLSLRNNNVHNYGATRLAIAMKRNRTLLHLDLGDNPLLREWLAPDHMLYTEVYPDGIPSITASLTRNKEFQKDLRLRYENQRRREEAAAAEAERRRRVAEEAERRRRRKKRRHKQLAEGAGKDEAGKTQNLTGTTAMSMTLRTEAESEPGAESELALTMTPRSLLGTQALGETHAMLATGALEDIVDEEAQPEEPPLTPELLSFLLPPEPNDVLCPQAKMQGEWQQDRRWLSKDEVDRARHGGLQAIEQRRQAEEDKVVDAAVREAGEKARVMLQSPFHGGRLLSVVMRGLRFVNAGQGVPSTEDLMLNMEPAFDMSSGKPRAKPTKKVKVEVKPEEGKKGKEEAKGEVEEEEEPNDGMDEEENKHIYRIFQAYDSNCSGSIDGEEFAFMCRDLCLPLTPKEVQDVMASLDADKSGEISYDEFYQWFRHIGRATQGKRRFRTAMMRISNVLKNAPFVLARSEASRVIIMYHERQARAKAMVDFRAKQPPNHFCPRCNKAFAHDDVDQGLSEHAADPKAHAESDRQDQVVGPRLAVVEHALEVLQRERNLQWPKLFVLAEAASQGRPYPILDRPDDKTGRTIGGLDADTTIKGLAFHHNGEWLQIEYKMCEQAYIRRRRGLTYYVTPLVHGLRASYVGRMIHKASVAAMAPNRRQTCGSRLVTRMFPGIRKISESLIAWPIKVGQMDYYPSPKYYRCGPGLPSGVQLKVRTQPEVDARILGYLKDNYLIKVLGKSGDWAMVVYKNTEHAWMLTRNRKSRLLIVEETNQYLISLAITSGASPFECKVEEDDPYMMTSREEVSETDSIIGLLATTVLDK